MTDELLELWRNFPLDVVYWHYKNGVLHKIGHEIAYPCLHGPSMPVLKDWIIMIGSDSTHNVQYYETEDGTAVYPTAEWLITSLVDNGDRQFPPFILSELAREFGGDFNGRIWSCGGFSLGICNNNSVLYIEIWIQSIAGTNPPIFEKALADPACDFMSFLSKVLPKREEIMKTGVWC